MIAEPGSTNGFYIEEEVLMERRLFDAIESSSKALDPFRNLNRNLTNEYLGHNYSMGRSGTGKRKKYINKMFQAVNGHLMIMAGNNPQGFIQTEYLELRGFARHYQTHLNNLLKEIEFAETHRRWVLSSLFCLGVIKVHMKESGIVVHEGDIAADTGLPFASNVYLDDWVHDMSVRRKSQLKFCGDMYRIPFADFQQGIIDGTYIKENSKDVKPTSKNGDDDPDRVENISKGATTDIDEYEPMLDLADIWLPREGVIKTFVVSNRTTFRLTGRPVAVMEWDGVERGPYELLSISDAPENIMPASIAGYWEAMDEFINISMRKHVRHVSNMKENLCANSAGSGAAKKLRSANDLEVLTDVDLNHVRSFRQGGADPNLMTSIQQAQDVFDEQASNLKSLLGTGPQADTLGQEQLIQAAGNRIASQMQSRVVDATASVYQNIGYLLWYDQFREAAGNISVIGYRGEVTEIPSPWLPGDREGNVQQYNFSIIPVSLVQRTPIQQAQLVMQLLNQLFLPGMQAMQMQGVTLDFSSLVDILSDLLYVPEIRRFITTIGMPNPESQKPQAEIMGKSPVTTRNYNRRSMGGQSPSGNQLVHQMPMRNGSQSWSQGGGIVE
jgi:hypothetical protein